MMITHFIYCLPLFKVVFSRTKDIIDSGKYLNIIKDLSTAKNKQTTLGTMSTDK